MKVRILSILLSFVCLCAPSFALKESANESYSGLSNQGFEGEGSFEGLETEAGLNCSTEECKRLRAEENKDTLSCFEKVNTEMCQSVPEDSRKVCAFEEKVVDYVSAVPSTLVGCPVLIFKDIWEAIRFAYLFFFPNFLSENPIEDGLYFGHAFNYLVIETIKDEDPGQRMKQVSKDVAASIHQFLSEYVEVYGCYSRTRQLTEICRFTGDLLSFRWGVRSIDRWEEAARERYKIKRILKKGKKNAEKAKSVSDVLSRRVRNSVAHSSLIRDFKAAQKVNPNFMADLDKELENILSKVYGKADPTRVDYKIKLSDLKSEVTNQLMDTLKASRMPKLYVMSKNLNIDFKSPEFKNSFSRSYKYDGDKSRMNEILKSFDDFKNRGHRIIVSSYKEALEELRKDIIILKKNGVSVTKRTQVKMEKALENLFKEDFKAAKAVKSEGGARISNTDPFPSEQIKALQDTVDTFRKDMNIN